MIDWWVGAVFHNHRRYRRRRRCHVQIFVYVSAELKNVIRFYTGLNSFLSEVTRFHGHIQKHGGFNNIDLLQR